MLLAELFVAAVIPSIFILLLIIRKDRFEKEASFCIHCGLCVRYCAEVKQAHAVGFIDRGSQKEISFIPQLALEVCWDCKECFPLCPTEALQAAYMLVRALSPDPAGL